MAASKRPKMGDHLDDMLGAPKGSKPEASADPGDMRIYNVRLPVATYQALQAHFKARGLRAGTGIRQVVMEYAREHGLL